MDIYKCKVRLSGSLLNEVPKINVSAPEVIVLQHTHGSDAVVDLRKTGEKRADNFGERDRLASIYGFKVVGELFGPQHRELPGVAPSYEAPKAEDVAPVEDAPMAASLLD